MEKHIAKGFGGLGLILANKVSQNKRWWFDFDGDPILMLIKARALGGGGQILSDFRENHFGELVSHGDKLRTVQVETRP